MVCGAVDPGVAGDRGGRAAWGVWGVFVFKGVGTHSSLTNKNKGNRGVEGGGSTTVKPKTKLLPTYENCTRAGDSFSSYYGDEL